MRANYTTDETYALLKAAAMIYSGSIVVNGSVRGQVAYLETIKTAVDAAIEIYNELDKR